MGGHEGVGSGVGEGLGAFFACTKPFCAGFEVQIGSLKIVEKISKLGMESHCPHHCMVEGAVEGDVKRGTHLTVFSGELLKTFKNPAKYITGKVVMAKRFRNFFDFHASERDIFARVVAVKIINKVEEMTSGLLTLCHHSVADQTKKGNGSMLMGWQLFIFDHY